MIPSQPGGARAPWGPRLASTTAAEARATPAVKSAYRTLAVLEYLGTARSCTLGNIADALSIPKSSLHALLRTMQACGWVETDQTGTLYHVGLRALLAGTAYVESDDIATLSAPVLDQIATRTGETVHLGRLDGANIIYLAKRESVHELRMYSGIGRRLPAHATALGKALLASLPGDEVDRRLQWPLVRLTPNTIVDRAALHEELQRVRDQGYAIDEGENALDIHCVAIGLSQPLPGVNAVSCSVPVSRATPATMLAARGVLLESVANLDAVIGSLRTR